MLGLLGLLGRLGRGAALDRGRLVLTVAKVRVARPGVLALVVVLRAPPGAIGVAQLGVDDLPARDALLLEDLEHPRVDLLELGVEGQRARLLGVALQVEGEDVVVLGLLDDLERAHHEATAAAREPAAHPARAIRRHVVPAQIDPRELGPGGEAGQVEQAEDRGEEVQGAAVAAGHARRDAGPGDHEGDAHALLVQVLVVLLDAVGAEPLAVVPDGDHHRVVAQGAVVDHVEEGAEQLVLALDQAGVALRVGALGQAELLCALLDARGQLVGVMGGRGEQGDEKRLVRGVRLVEPLAQGGHEGHVVRGQVPQAVPADVLPGLEVVVAELADQARALLEQALGALEERGAVARAAQHGRQAVGLDVGRKLPQLALQEGELAAQHGEQGLGGVGDHGAHDRDLEAAVGQGQKARRVGSGGLAGQARVVVAGGLEEQQDDVGGPALVGRGGGPRSLGRGLVAVEGAARGAGHDPAREGDQHVVAQAADVRVPGPGGEGDAQAHGGGHGRGQGGPVRGWGRRRVAAQASHHDVGRGEGGEGGQTHREDHRREGVLGDGDHVAPAVEQGGQGRGADLVAGHQEVGRVAQGEHRERRGEGDGDGAQASEAVLDGGEGGGQGQVHHGVQGDGPAGPAHGPGGLEPGQAHQLGHGGHGPGRQEQVGGRLGEGREGQVGQVPQAQAPWRPGGRCAAHGRRSLAKIRGRGRGWTGPGEIALRPDGARRAHGSRPGQGRGGGPW